MRAKEIVRLIGGGRLMAVVSVKTASGAHGIQAEIAECIWCSHGVPKYGDFPVESLEVASTVLVRRNLPTRIEE